MRSVVDRQRIAADQPHDLVVAGAFGRLEGGPGRVDLAAAFVVLVDLVAVLLPVVVVGDRGAEGAGFAAQPVQRGHQRPYLLRVGGERARDRLQFAAEFVARRGHRLRGGEQLLRLGRLVVRRERVEGGVDP
ncbi:hypothetical protein [Streptomyces sp. Tu 6176]|uniref:hypothetical protein n=1 Tax=Streptomyces sp. Tu 6176 TaxID=1470557 RepID=UPI00131A0793|nr:hypothetical protein [Streptomyces sp. Tu 6176]